jgi:16S rRNA A1518/A1519 N6-dimethyltransferase RsmA/KsgA/DIM1 with predicted DNA glycosylase/AP lyase activity
MAVLRDPEETETRILHQLADFAGKDVLEIGSGNGRLTWRYANQARTVLGIESDAAAVASAQEALPAHLRSTVAFRVGDVTTTELQPTAYDIALLAWSL